ncbi:MAG: acireductone synthase [Wenzhouxiangellaceae bacterium]|nr:acireductone synthase [Wenzhouxiangellaceae bacterium]
MSRIILTDIEGTIGDTAFVKSVLFPYARRALPAFVQANADEPEVARELQQTAALAGLDDSDQAAIVDTLLDWIDQDRKATPLKNLQGMIWHEGYRQSHFQAHLYVDAYDWLQQRHREGVPLFVYSSGSVQAQKLYFAHTEFGDIEGWFSGFFDTATGPKQAAGSYRKIAGSIDRSPEDLVFFSDIEAELDAAAEAGLVAIQIVRPGTESSGRYRSYPDFTAIELQRL